MLNMSFIARFEYYSNDPMKSDLYLEDLNKVLGYYLNKISNNVFSFNLEVMDKLEVYNDVDDFYIGSMYLKLHLSFNNDIEGGEISYLLYNEYSFMPSLNNLMPIYFAYEKETKTKIIYKGKLEIAYDDNSYYNHTKLEENKITALGEYKVVHVDFGANKEAAFKTKLEVFVGAIVYGEGEYSGLPGVVLEVLDYYNQPMMLDLIEAYNE